MAMEVQVQAALGVICLIFIGWAWKHWNREGSRDGKTVLITGCDTGLGAEAVNYAVKQKIKIIATCLTNEAVQRIKTQYQNTIDVFQLDVTDDSSVTRCVEYVNQICPNGLWCLVNNAGIGDTFLVEMTPMKTYEQVMAVNYFGTVRMCKALLPSIKKCQGRIVNVASFLGRTSAFGFSSYCASKHAVEGFSIALRQEMRPFGVKVILVEPGTMRTSLLSHVSISMHRLWTSASASQRAEYGPTFLRAVDNTNWVMNLLARDASSFVTAIFQGAFQLYPKNHHLVGFDSFLMGGILPLLPSGLVDFVAYVAVGMPKPKQAVAVHTNSEAHVD